LPFFYSGGRIMRLGNQRGLILRGGCAIVGMVVMVIGLIAAGASGNKEAGQTLAIGLVFSSIWTVINSIRSNKEEREMREWRGQEGNEDEIERLIEYQKQTPDTSGSIEPMTPGEAAWEIEKMIRRKNEE